MYREVINNNGHNNIQDLKKGHARHKNCGAVHSGSIKLIIRGKFDPNNSHL